MSVTKNKTKVLKSEKNIAKFLDDVCLEIPAIVCLTHRKENGKKIRKLVLRPFEEGL